MEEERFLNYYLDLLIFWLTTPVYIFDLFLLIPKHIPIFTLVFYWERKNNICDTILFQVWLFWQSTFLYIYLYNFADILPAVEFNTSFTCSISCIFFSLSLSLLSTFTKAFIKTEGLYNKFKQRKLFHITLTFDYFTCILYTLWHFGKFSPNSYFLMGIFVQKNTCIKSAIYRTNCFIYKGSATPNFPVLRQKQAQMSLICLKRSIL